MASNPDNTDTSEPQIEETECNIEKLTDSFKTNLFSDEKAIANIANYKSLKAKNKSINASELKKFIQKLSSEM